MIVYNRSIGVQSMKIRVVSIFRLRPDCHDCTRLYLIVTRFCTFNPCTIGDNRRQSITILIQSWIVHSLIDCHSIEWVLQSDSNSYNQATIRRQSIIKKKKISVYETLNASIPLQSDLNPDWIMWQSSFNPLSIKDRQSYTDPYNQETILQNRGNKKKVRLYTIRLTIEWQSCTNPIKVHEVHMGTRGAQGVQYCFNRRRLLIISTIF